MIRLTRILLPIDFSELASEATTYACALAGQFNAELHLLYVYENSVIPESVTSGVDWEIVAQDVQKAAEAKMEQVLDPAWEKGRTVVKSTVEGAPFLEIIRYARQHDIDLIVMATHGRTGVAHLLVGSVAENVVRQAPCPVLTVHPKGHQFVMP